LRDRHPKSVAKAVTSHAKLGTRLSSHSSPEALARESFWLYLELVALRCTSNA
jgi:hypothetical protein